VEPVRFGLIGYGFGGRYFHAPLIASAPGCELVAVQTTAPQRRAEVARELPGAAVVGDLEELLVAGVSAVAISTPADTHTALTEQALRLGLAVVCDKPFALDAAAARGTVELADGLGLALSPYQNRRWDSDFATVRRLVDEGALGEVTRFESRFERFAPQAGPPAAGGGTLLDFGAHLVDQALVLLGPVESVYAELRVRESGLDDDVFLALTHAGGARSHLWGSWSQSAPGPRYRVTGTAGSCVLL
jgi:predicted dehydrogenase